MSHRARTPLRSRPLPRATWALLCLAPAAAGAAAAAPQDDAEVAALVAAERAEADLLRRRGDLRGAVRALSLLLEDEPSDGATRALLGRCRYEEGSYGEALELGRQALEDVRGSDDPALVAECARTLAETLLGLGHYEEALAVLEPDPGDARFLDPGGDARDAWVLGRALAENGDREAARRVWELGLAARRDAGWEQLWAKGLCEWRLGRLEEASRSFVLADRAAKAADGVEPDVLAALGALYFESEREVEAPGKRSAGALFKEALERHPAHEAALLGLFELHRYNRRRVSRAPEEILADLLEANPDSIEGLLAKVSADLSDGLLVGARESLARLDELAPGRRELSTLRAALAWVEHRREDCEGALAELLRRDPGDSRPEREVGRHLIELYRFAEAVPFLERSVERDASDWQAWTYLGRALANTGDEDAAREALERAEKAAAGRQDAWRNNTQLVLQRMRDEHVVEQFGELGFSWQPDAAAVLRTYLVPYYTEAREELARRYGHTPSTTVIEVFRRHQDFSVRSVGFEGFPALGVCFGPVVTALSPLSEMRGTFSWARTGFHEFSHVVHLGLSHNRCPRWITEGLATWEEVERNPTWTRNMRRELVDARANDDLIPVRELNRAFRGPRILFGYYQGGLLCTMLIERHGFAPMIHLLEAFDRGLDLDEALGEVFDVTPEELDRDFEAWVDELVADLAIEPRWSTGRIARLRLSLRREPPADDEERRAWAEDWTTVAWGSWQRGRRLDAEEALRRADEAGGGVVRALFLRGEMALEADQPAKAKAAWKAALDGGGRDFRALLGLGGLCEADLELEEAERYYLLAEQAFPGYDHPELNAEHKLAELYRKLDRVDDEMAARERWLAWNAGEYDQRVKVARWHADNGRFERASELYHEANEVDPFRRDLHVEWGDVLAELGRWTEAEREYRVATEVPAELDLDHLRYVGPADRLPPGNDFGGKLPPAALHALPPELLEPVPLTAAERAELVRKMARCAREAGRPEAAAEHEARAAELEADG